MIGAVFGGWFQDRVGRRIALGTSALLSAAGIAIMFVSYIPTSIMSKRLLFLFGKIVQGVAIGTNITSAQTYLSEILPPALRASGMAFFPIFACLGQLSGALVIYFSLGQKKGYITAFGSQWPFSFLPIVVALLIPESPTWYIRRKEMDKAFAAQKRLDPVSANTQVTIDRLTAAIAHEEAITATTSIWHCFDKQNLRRTMIVLWAQSFQALWGMPLLSKVSYFLQVIGMGPDKSIIILIVGLVLGFFANSLGVWLVTKVGRRPLIMSTLCVVALIWASMGVANCFKGKVVVWYVLLFFLPLQVF
jgi:MFS family permease